MMLALFLLFNLSACAEKKAADPEPKAEAKISDQAKPEAQPQPAKAVKPENLPGVFGNSQTKTITARVEAIDLEKRIVTLNKASGEQIKFAADKKVKNLPQVKVGDEVKCKIYESLTVRVLEKDEPDVPQATSETIQTSPEGQKPAGVATTQFKTAAKIMSIDKKKSKATLKFADGKTHIIDVQNHEYLDKVKIGDRIEIAQTESIAIQVTAVPKKADAKKK